MPMGRNDPVGRGYPVPQNLRVDQDSDDPDELFGVSEDVYTVFAHPDGDSERRSKINFEPISRGGEYPYDEPGGTYGAPNSTSPPHSVTHSFEITPKDTKHSAWDDLDEAIGYPAYFKKGSESQRGGGSPSARGWSNNPAKDWDKSEFDEDFDATPIPSEFAFDPVFGALVARSKPKDVQQTSSEPAEELPKSSVWGELVKLMMMKDLMKQQRKQHAAVVIRAGDASDEDHDE